MTSGACASRLPSSSWWPFAVPEIPMLAARNLLVVLALALAAPLPALARQDAVSNQEAVVTSEAFLNGHPDLRYRLSGLRHYREGRYEKAFEQFQRAARYADKPAQGMVAEMLRPMLRDWLDANLPGIVQTAVQKEVERIARSAG